MGVQDHPASAEPIRPAAVAHGKSPTRIAMDRLRKDKIAVICAVVVLFFILVAVFAPLLAKLEGQDYSTFHPDLVDEFGFPTIGLTPDHWFGVEPKTGRDNFARWVYGARPSLIVAFTATAVRHHRRCRDGSAGRLPRWLGGPGDLLGHRLRAEPSVPAVRDRDGPDRRVVARRFVQPDARGQASTRFYVLIFVLSFFGWAGLARHHPR